MKRKFLSVLLTLAMALTLLPVSAMADETAEAPAATGGETPAVEYVAKVGEQGYATLAEAVEKAADGDTVTLLGDAELTEMLNITKAITLDGANHKITGNSSVKKSLIKVKTNGDFTLTNCTFAPTTAYVNDTVGVRTAVYLKVGGNATVTNNTFEGIDDGYYNAIEFGINDDPALEGANISGNTFTKPIQNNYFSFYNLKEGAVVDIQDGSNVLISQAGTKLPLKSQWSDARSPIQTHKDGGSLVVDSGAIVTVEDCVNKDGGANNTIYLPNNTTYTNNGTVNATIITDAATENSFVVMLVSDGMTIGVQTAVLKDSKFTLPAAPEKKQLHFQGLV